MTLHLTHEQLCDLILADSSLPPEGEPWNDREADSDIVQAHLQACLVCSAELRSLRDSLSHFRNASVSYARQEFQSWRSGRRRPLSWPYSQYPLYWTAAALVFVLLCSRSAYRRRPVPPVIATAASTSAQITESMMHRLPT
jgi:hypothetical protein